MPAPSLIQYAECANWGIGGSRATSTSITWLTGDVIVALAGIESGYGSYSSVPTATGLTFAAISGAVSGTSSSYCYANAWVATAAGGGTQAVTFTETGPYISGFAVWVWRGSGGVGNIAASGATANTALTISLVRGSGNSCVVGGGFDWGANVTTGYSFTPTATNQRQHAQEGTGYTVYVADWGDQGTAGTTSYGVAGVTVGAFTKVFIEVKGTAATYTPVFTQKLATQQAVKRASLW